MKQEIKESKTIEDFQNVGSSFSFEVVFVLRVSYVNRPSHEFRICIIELEFVRDPCVNSKTSKSTWVKPLMGCKLVENQMLQLDRQF